MYKYKYYLFFSLLIFSQISFSQKYQYINGEKGFENWKHNIYYNGGNKLLDINYMESKKPNYKAVMCDLDLKNVTSKAINFLDDKDYIFSYFRFNRLYLFATDKKKTLYKYQVNPADFSLIGSPETIFSFEDDGTEYRFAYSQDSTFFSIVCRHFEKKAESNNYDGIIFNSDFSTATKFKFEITAPNNELFDIDFPVSSTGKAAIICQYRSRGRGKNDKGIYHFITTVSTSGETHTVTVSEAIEGEIQDLNWWFHNDVLSFTGLARDVARKGSIRVKSSFAGKSPKDGYTCIISGDCNSTSGELENIKSSAFAESGSKSPSDIISVQEIAENGIPVDVDLKASLVLSDNSTLLIYDQSGNYVPSTYDPYNPTKYQPKITRFYGGNTYVLKLNKSRELEWFHAIQKQQLEAAIDLYGGTVYALDSKDGIHIFFHDNQSNDDVYSSKKIRDAMLSNIKKNSLACVYITSSGVAGKSFLQDNSDAASFMLPKVSCFIKKNEVTFIAWTKSKDENCTFAKIKITE